MDKDEVEYIDRVIESWEKQIAIYKKHLETKSVTPILRKIVIRVIEDKERLLKEIKNGREEYQRRQEQQEEQGQ